MKNQVKAFCSLPFTKVKLAPNGGISNCCQQVNNVFGNILKQNFDEIWFGNLLQETRSMTKNGELHNACSPYFCPFKFQQRTMEEITYGKYPNQLEIDIPDTQCNIGGENPRESGGACVMCRRNDPNWIAEEDRLYEAIEKIKFLIPHLTDLHIQGIAEPLYKDHVFRILSLLEYEKYKQKIMMSTLTNGTLLNERNSVKLIKLCPKSKLGISIDAATPETYRKIRKVDGFDMIKNNIKLYNRHRNKQHQYLWITNNINIINVEETVLMVELAKELGVDAVELSPTTYAQERCGALMVNEANYELFQAAEEAAKNKAEELGMKLLIYSPLAMNHKKQELVQLKLM